MTTALQRCFSDMVEYLDTTVLTAEYIYKLVDLTCLDEQATNEKIISLTKHARNHQVAAVCVYPQHLDWIPDLNPIRRATVVNFPNGNSSSKRVIAEIEQAIVQQQADEIDYVFAYGGYLSGQSRQAIAQCHDAYNVCQQHGRLFKVILETGAFPSIDMIHQLSCEVIEAGCDMLKTSTGKIEVGASMPAAFAMLTAINQSQKSCGIKVSGGIRTLQQASNYIHLAEHVSKQSVDKRWFRIGASSIA